MLGYIALFLALGALYLVHVVNVSVVQSVRRLQDIDTFFESVSNISDGNFKHAANEAAAWAEHKGFVADDYFLLHTQDSGVPLKCASWWLETNRTFLLFYYAEEGERVSTMTDFHSQLSHGCSLTTGSSIDGLLLPHPNDSFIQCLPNLSLDELFNRHKRSLKSISSKHGFKLRSRKPSLYRLIRKSLKAQADHVVSLSFWKLRGAYWYFIRRHLLSNRVH